MLVATPNGHFEIDPEDIYIGSHVLGGRVFENHIINDTLKPYIEKSKYIVDVGANIGCHAISYANFNPECVVWAFEPQQKLFNVLSNNIVHNNLSERIHASKCGLGHAEMASTLSSLANVFDAKRRGFNKGGLGIGFGGEPIDIKTLDSFDLPGLDFIKIDVEGAEGLVIQGGRETIKKFKPIVFFEHNYQTVDPMVLNLDHAPSPFEELVKLGYKTFTYVDWDNYITEG